MAGYWNQLSFGNPFHTQIKMSNVKIIHDSEGFYPDGTIIECKELIKYYKDGLTDSQDDIEFKQWMDSVSEESAVYQIAVFWNLDIEIV